MRTDRTSITVSRDPLRGLHLVDFRDGEAHIISWWKVLAFFLIMAAMVGMMVLAIVQQQRFADEKRFKVITATMP